MNNEFSKLDSSSRKLEINPEQFFNDVNEISKELSCFIGRCSSAPGKAESVNIPGKSKLIDSIYNQLDGGIETASGNFLGFIPGGGLLTGAYADLITAVTNKYVGLSFAAPGAANVENEVIEWLIGLFSFNEDSWGSLTSGGTSATINAFMAAYETIPKEIDRKDLVFYISEEAHHCIKRALKISGFKSRNIHIVSNNNRKMDLRDLSKAIEIDLSKNLYPFMVIGTAGTTNFGVVDNLKGISEISKQNNLWFHLDAAYGGFFRLCGLLDGIELADSIVVDPHKGMFLNYGVGAVIVKNGKLLRLAYADDPEYLQETKIKESRSPADYSYELTRHNRALRIKLSLDYFGESQFKMALREKLLLTTYLYSELRKINSLIIWGEPDLTVVAFKLKENSKTQDLLNFINNNGTFVSSTKIGSDLWIRACLLSFRTHKEHVDLLLKSIERFSYVD